MVLQDRLLSLVLIKLKLFSFDCLLFACYGTSEEIVRHLSVFKSVKVRIVSESIDLKREPRLKAAPLTYVLDIDWPDCRLCKTVHNLWVDLGDFQKVVLCLLHLFLLVSN